MLKRILNLAVLFLLIPSLCFGAISEGTNAGFVTSAPTADPGGANAVFDAKSAGGKFSSPAGSNAISSMGWWCDTATEEANYELGIYSHDATNDKPNVLLAANQTNAKGTDAGWKTSSVSYTLSASTTYWLAAQLDNTATATRIDIGGAGSGSYSFETSATLPASWTSAITDTRIIAIYAVYGAVSTARRIIFIQ